MKKLKIELPHINYIVEVVPITKKNAKLSKIAETEKFDNKSVIRIPFPPKRHEISTVVHEIIHVLRFICEDRNMDFTLESEHMAYIATHILNKIMSLEYT